MKIRTILFLILLAVLFSQCRLRKEIDLSTNSGHDLCFASLARSWDEGIPLGNGMVGALVWDKEGKLHISLDRADLWDLRPMMNMQGPEYSFQWVRQHVLDKDYRPVQEQFDVPYDRDPAPTKIPAAALEFPIGNLGTVASIALHVESATCEVRWTSGVRMITFVHATQPVGWFRFDHLPEGIIPNLQMPSYQVSADSGDENPVTGQDLRRLGYIQGTIRQGPNTLTYRQEGWKGFWYQVQVYWKNIGKNSMVGVWSISSQYPDKPVSSTTGEQITSAMERGFRNDYDSHRQWWDAYWKQSAVKLPDSVLEKQWYLEQYKFGSASRRGAPPISLQAVWTADNGKIPPWKGDFHHDLNTQLSYWPCYSGNHLEEGLAYLDWLWDTRFVAKKYTKAYFGTEGLNVPGVTTLRGEPMGGWIQYSLSPTMGAWLAQHFYLHWRYSMDTTFLRERAYPYISDIALHLEQISAVDKNGIRRLPMSSSPEIHDNSLQAWYLETTNFDLALVRWTFQTAAELADVLGYNGEAAHYRSVLSEWPGFAISPKNGAMEVAPGESLTESHRHFSQLMAIHPLGLIDGSKGPLDRAIIQHSLHELDSLGPDYWCGYSYSWLGNLQARAKNGERAAEALRIFAECFCLPNSFHVNGDQSGTGKSKFTYRPFTLEGNFAFAAGIQEMLLQSHTGIVEVFPAIPASWEDVSFTRLRAEGAFLISASRKQGKITELVVEAEKGGVCRVKNPFDRAITGQQGIEMEESTDGTRILVLRLARGESRKITDGGEVLKEGGIRYFSTGDR